MSTHETLLQNIRRWLKLAASLTDAQVVVANTDMVRPPKPYLTVQLLTADVQIGHDERLQEDDAGTQRHVVRGVRRATVSVQGFGAETSGWLTLAHVSLENPIVSRQLDQDGLSISSLGGTNDISARVDTRMEPRFSRDFEVVYGVQTTDGPTVDVASSMSVRGEIDGSTETALPIDEVSL